jgi:hypothetical protein
MVDKYLFYALCLAAIVYLKSVSISDFALLSFDSKQSRTSSYCRFTKPHDNLPVEKEFKINCAAIARVSFIQLDLGICFRTLLRNFAKCEFLRIGNFCKVRILRNAKLCEM